ncbi:MAG: UDP-N-acetylglucosamine--N-acetylmuramyl-(pentapeptide) pyrophosphoryl-undecaprenol N-acetylglucosamine transferase [Oscillospiraceae bacterium]|jgi:UDP-N-acetylglucosamine--N-acetylmuramyl-(pentapeptide) pyrophosphoryl-undecaprenol N-acetylglucosamine transferase|nr:UDP-N-acetylglucosamine--N-acetylmuramyl-(pentapeptide) pyrophosphoryl-undecaprenol N-acetylglucosamine transferase [Oscillospiraceae bacterium]
MKRIVLTGGGSAGHVNPALAIADAVRAEFGADAEFLYIGALGKLEQKLVPKAGYKFVPLNIAGGLRRSVNPRDIAYNARALAKNQAAVGTAKRILRDFKPDIVIGTGGYVCYPVLRAAYGLKLKSLLYECNVYPGLTVKSLANGADGILLGFEEARKYFSEKNQSKLTVTGIPVRKEFAEARADAESSGKPLLVSFWGSLGAKHMNTVLLDFIRLNEERGRFRHIHATGEHHYEAFEERLPKRLAYTEVVRYIDDMAAKLQASSLAICRAGASTLNELAVLGKPAVLVPSPYVAENHQEINARAIESRGNAIVLREKDCTAEALFEAAEKALGLNPAPDREILGATERILSVIREQISNIKY